jgi:hypothetical protein
MSADPRAAARQFVRSLNILMKFARLYEFGHVRTAAQFETTWKNCELRWMTAVNQACCWVRPAHRFCWMECLSARQQPNAVSRNCYQPQALPAFTSHKIFRRRNSPVCAGLSGNQQHQILRSGGTTESRAVRETSIKINEIPHRGGFIRSGRKNRRQFSGESHGAAGRQV